MGYLSILDCDEKTSIDILNNLSFYLISNPLFQRNLVNKSPENLLTALSVLLS